MTLTYRYDQAGLQRSVTPSTTSTACLSNDYDDLDRLNTVTTVVVAACGTSKASTVTYTYDGVDRQRFSTTTVGLGSTETKTTYDGLSRTTVGQSNSAAGDDSKPTTLYQLTPDGHHIAMWQAMATGCTVNCNLTEQRETRTRGCRLSARLAGWDT